MMVGAIPQHFNGLLSAVKYIKIIQSGEEVGNIRGIIIIAGESRADVESVGHYLKKEGYSFILCKTVKGLIEELKILPVCSVQVSLVIVEPQMLIKAGGDLVTELSKCAPNVLFVLLDKVNTLPSVEELLSGSMQHLTITGSELSEHIFRTQCMKILGFAKADLLELDDRTPDAQTILTMLSALVEIADLARRMVKPEVSALAETAIDLVEDVQLNKRCILSNGHKESFLTLLDAIKQHV